jgi:hypothetical protein
MHLSGLSEDVDFDGAAAPPRLLHQKTGRLLELTATEAQMVPLFSSGTGLEQLTEMARAQGVAVELPQVAAFLQRLGRAGFIPKVEIQQPIPDVPTPLEPSDALPRLRADLRIAPSSSAPGLIEVVDPGRNRSFTLYDFEVSVVQMLDGQRNAEDIIESAGRIGIPVTFGSLKNFIRQMAAYGFLAPPGVATGTGPARPPRRTWSPDIRQLFQGALRLYRSGKSGEAVDFLTAVLQIDPQNTEGKELKQRVEGRPEVDLNFDILHGESTEMPEEISAPEVEVAEVAAQDAAPEPAAGAVDADVPPAFGLLQELASSRPPGRGRWILGGCAVAVVGCLLFPVHTRVAVPCQLEPVVLAAVPAPRDGELASHPVAAGALVKAQDVLATLATDDLKKKLAEAQSRLPGERTKLERLRKKAKPAAGAKLKPKLELSKKALDKALALQTKWTAAPASASQKQQLDKAARAVAAARAALTAIDRKYQALTGDAALASAQEQVTADQAEVQRLVGQIGASVIAAPAAGLFLPTEGAGSHLVKDQPYGRIVKPDALHLTASPPASLTKGDDLAGAALQLPPGRKGDLQGLTWMAGPAGPAEGKLEATVEGATPEKGAQPEATLQIPTGLRPLVWQLLQ